MSKIDRESLPIQQVGHPLNLTTRGATSGTDDRFMKHSGYVFTGHLSAVSEECKDTVGHGKTAQWPKSFVKAPKNDGVTATIKQTPGAIGYVEYGFAKRLGLLMASLQNKAGRHVEPSSQSGQAALAANVSRIPSNL